MEVNELLNIAICELENLNKGEIFLVKDLFKGYFWNRLKVSERILLGTLFLNYIKTHKDVVEIYEKTSSHQQRYVKL